MAESIFPLGPQHNNLGASLAEHATRGVQAEDRGLWPWPPWHKWVRLVCSHRVEGCQVICGHWAQQQAKGRLVRICSAWYELQGSTKLSQLLLNTPYIMLCNSKWTPLKWVAHLASAQLPNNQGWAANLKTILLHGLWDLGRRKGCLFFILPLPQTGMELGKTRGSFHFVLRFYLRPFRMCRCNNRECLN